MNARKCKTKLNKMFLHAICLCMYMYGQASMASLYLVKWLGWSEQVYTSIYNTIFRLYVNIPQQTYRRFSKLCASWNEWFARSGRHDAFTIWIRRSNDERAFAFEETQKYARTIHANTIYINAPVRRANTNKTQNGFFLTAHHHSDTASVVYTLLWLCVRKYWKWRRL